MQTREDEPGVVLLPRGAGALENTMPEKSPPWSQTTKTLVAVAALLLMVIVIWRFRALIQPIVLAVILAYLLNPLVQLSQRRLKLSRGAAVGLVYGGALLILVGGLAAIGYVAFDQTERLFASLPHMLETSSAWIRENVLGRALQIGPFAYTIPVFDEALSSTELVRQAANALNLSPMLGGSVAAGLASLTFGILSTFFVVMFIAVYLGKDSPLLWGRITEVARAPGYHTDAERLSRDFLRVWAAYLRGQVLLGLAMFVIVSIVLTALGVNYSLALGALSGLLEFLPIIGPTVATVAAALVAIFQDSNYLGLSPVWFAVVIVAVMFLLQQIESAVLVPRFVGDALDLHPVVVIVVVLMGTSLAGILGAVLAAPVAATVKLFGTYGWRKMFDLPPFPVAEPVPEEDDGGVWGMVAGLWRKPGSGQ